METVESVIRVSATLLGATSILAPIICVVLGAGRPKGRSSGRAAISRTWPAVLLIAIILVALGFVLWKPLPSLNSRGIELALLTVGACFYFPGVGLYLLGFIILGSQFRVSGVLGAELYRGHKLITNGPFAVIRHPMYMGVLLAAVGAFLIFRTWAMTLFMPMCLVVLRRAEHEEALLEEEFGEKWMAYASNVPKWLPRF